MGFTRGWVKQRILWRRLDCSVVIEVMAEEVWPADKKHTMQAEGVRRRGDQEFLIFFLPPELASTSFSCIPTSLWSSILSYPASGPWLFAGCAATTGGAVRCLGMRSGCNR